MSNKFHSENREGEYLEVGLPLLVAEEGERAEPGHCGWDKPRKRHERVLDDEGADLARVRWVRTRTEEREMAGLTACGLR